jgi:hypothetical protein
MLQGYIYPNKDVNTPRRVCRPQDLKDVRPVDSTAYGVLNNIEQPIKPEIISALQQYRIRPLPWSKRVEYAEELAE